MMSDELRAIPLFAGVSDHGLEIALAGGEVEVAGGQVVAQAGDAGSGMFVVLEGTVTIDLHGATVEIGPGEFFGELALLVADAVRVGRVRASSAARLLVVPRATFELLLETEPSFCRRLLDDLAARLVAARSGR